MGRTREVVSGSLLGAPAGEPSATSTIDVGIYAELAFLSPKLQKARREPALTVLSDRLNR